jgi:hypothetical protein
MGGELAYSGQNMMNAAGTGTGGVGGQQWFQSLSKGIRQQFTIFQLSVKNGGSAGALSFYLNAPSDLFTDGIVDGSEANFPAVNGTTGALSVTKQSPGSINELQYIAKRNPIFVPYFKLTTSGSPEEQFANPIREKRINPFTASNLVDELQPDNYVNPEQDNSNILYVNQAVELNDQSFLEFTVEQGVTLTLAFPIAAIKNDAASLSETVERAAQGGDPFKEV